MDYTKCTHLYVQIPRVWPILTNFSSELTHSLSEERLLQCNTNIFTWMSFFFQIWSHCGLKSIYMDNKWSFKSANSHCLLYVEILTQIYLQSFNWSQNVWHQQWIEMNWQKKTQRNVNKSEMRMWGHVILVFILLNKIRFWCFVICISKVKMSKDIVTRQATKSPEKLEEWIQCSQTDFPFDYSGQETDRQTEAYIWIENSKRKGIVWKKKFFKWEKYTHTYIVYIQFEEVNTYISLSCMSFLISIKLSLAIWSREQRIKSTTLSQRPITKL